MADIGTLFFKNINENIYQEVFWVADYESAILNFENLTSYS